MLRNLLRAVVVSFLWCLIIVWCDQLGAEDPDIRITISECLRTVYNYIVLEYSLLKGALMRLMR